jgi:hypothetical protein
VISFFASHAVNGEVRVHDADRICEQNEKRAKTAVLHISGQ